MGIVTSVLKKENITNSIICKKNPKASQIMLVLNLKCIK